MNRARLRLALDVYAARAERDDADARWDAVDPSDEAAFEDACTRRQDARASYLRALEAHFEATNNQRELAAWSALHLAQLTLV